MVIYALYKPLLLTPPPFPQVTRSNAAPSCWGRPSGRSRRTWRPSPWSISSTSRSNTARTRSSADTSTSWMLTASIAIVGFEPSTKYCNSGIRTLCQRPRNYLSCCSSCCCSLFGSFHVKNHAAGLGPVLVDTCCLRETFYVMPLTHLESFFGARGVRMFVASWRTCLAFLWNFVFSQAIGLSEVS